MFNKAASFANGFRKESHKKANGKGLLQSEGMGCTKASEAIFEAAMAKAIIFYTQKEAERLIEYAAKQDVR